jgi:hypothetical protein
MVLIAQNWKPPLNLPRSHVVRDPSVPEWDRDGNLTLTLTLSSRGNFLPRQFYKWLAYPSDSDRTVIDDHSTDSTEST